MHVEYTFMYKDIRGKESLIFVKLTLSDASLVCEAARTAVPAEQAYKL